MSLAHCDKLFKKIAKSVDSQELSSLYQTLFTFYPLINYSIGRGSFYWRGRKSTISGFEFEQALKYPPTGLAKNGRLNNESEPCLYSATRIETVFRELGATEGDHIHLVGFRIRNSERLRIIAIGDLYHVFKTGYAKSVGSDPNNIIARQLNSYDPSVATQLLYADALLSDVLTDPDAKSKEYLQTRVLASEAYIKCGANAMFYPSAQDDAGMNLAILRDAYDNNTHVNCSQVIRINKVYAHGFYDYEVITHCQNIDSAGRFIWGDAPSPRHGTFFNFTKDEKDFIESRDQNDPNILIDLVKLHD